MAARFSSTYSTRLVPGMGTTSSGWASNHANASCPGRHPLSAARRDERLDRCEIGGQVLGREARIGHPKVAPVEGVVGIQGPGQRRPAKRAEGHQRDTQVAAGFRDALLDTSLPQRVFALQRGNGMPRRRAANQVGTTSLSPAREPCQK